MKKYLLWLGLLCGFLLSAVYFFSDTTKAFDTANPALTAYFFSIGQGDSTLIHTPENKWILVDGGPEYESATKAMNPILSSFTQKIDLIVLSHPHKDHIAGLMKVIEKYKVGNILFYKVPDNDLQEQFIKKSAEKGIPLIEADPEKDLQIDSVTYLDVLAPLPGNNENEKNINNLSVVFTIKSGGHTILFPGDAEAEEEEQLLHSGSYLDVEILKGGHHGSDTSTTIPFLDAATPEMVIYMNGLGNSFGHPKPETLKKLDERNIPYFNTSLDGTVTLTCKLEEEKCSAVAAERDQV